MKEYCLYKHTAPDGRVYIGITSQNPVARWASGNGYKGNTYFTRTINKYGWENFNHEILFSGLSEDEAKKLEIVLIELFESNRRDKGFNITRGGESASGLKISDRQREAISKANKGKVVSQKTREKLRKSSLRNWQNKDFVEHMREINLGKNNPQYGVAMTDKEKIARGAKTVCQYSMDGKIINEYISIHEANKATNISRDSISKCCKGIYSQAGGYMWAFKNGIFKQQGRECHRRMDSQRTAPGYAQKPSAGWHDV